MSIEVMATVWSNPAATHAQQIVLLAIADHADPQTREAWPSMERLARMCSLSPRAVVSQISALVAAGRIAKTVAGGRGKSNRYTVQRIQRMPFSESHSVNGVPETVRPLPTNRHEPSCKKKRRSAKSEPPAQIPPELADLPLYASDINLCRAWSALLPSILVSFPDRDWVLAKIRALHTWEVANPDRRKKRRARFFTNCMAKDWDKRIPSNHPNAASPPIDPTKMTPEEMAAYVRS